MCVCVCVWKSVSVRLHLNYVYITILCFSHISVDLQPNGGYCNIYEAHHPMVLAHCALAYEKRTGAFEKSCSNAFSPSLSSPCPVSPWWWPYVCPYCVFLRSSSPMARPPDATLSLLLGLFVVCGLALLGLLTFISWKLCSVHLQTKARFQSPSLSLAPGPEQCPLQPPLSPPSSQQPAVTMATEKVKDPMNSMGFLEAAVKISHTSPDIPTDVQLSMREHFLRRTQRMQRQTTEPASSTRLVTVTLCVCVLCDVFIHV